MARPSHGQGANGPASMPIRSKVSPVALRNAAIASGSLAAVPSRTIRRSTRVEVDIARDPSHPLASSLIQQLGRDRV